MGLTNYGSVEVLRTVASTDVKVFLPIPMRSRTS
jgi:hypothetical protein